MDAGALSGTAAAWDQAAAAWAQVDAAIDAARVATIAASVATAANMGTLFAVFVLSSRDARRAETARRAEQHAARQDLLGSRCLSAIYACVMLKQALSALVDEHSRFEDFPMANRVLAIGQAMITDAIGGGIDEPKLHRLALEVRVAANGTIEDLLRSLEGFKNQANLVLSRSLFHRYETAIDKILERLRAYWREDLSRTTNPVIGSVFEES
jgi:hypothetical protein